MMIFYNFLLNDEHKNLWLMLNDVIEEAKKKLVDWAFSYKQKWSLENYKNFNDEKK